MSVGDDLKGTMVWELSGHPNKWYVVIYDTDTSGMSYLFTSSLNTDQNLAVFATLEGWNIVDNGDVPGDSSFTGMTMAHDGSGITIDWVEEYTDQFPNLTGLDVVIHTQAWVDLLTDG